MKKVMILGGYGFLGQNLNNVFKKSNYLIFNESIGISSLLACNQAHTRFSCEFNFVSLYEK